MLYEHIRYVCMFTWLVRFVKFSTPREIENLCVSEINCKSFSNKAFENLHYF